MKLVNEAIAHQKAVLKINPRHPSYIRILFNHFATLLEYHLRHGEYREVARLALELPDLSKGIGPPLTGLDSRFKESLRVFWIDGDAWRVPLASADLLVRCLLMASKDNTLPESTRQELTRTYGDQAMLKIASAQAAGWTPDDLRTDPQLAPLRPRADFQKLVSELEAKKSGPKRP